MTGRIIVSELMTECEMYDAHCPVSRKYRERDGPIADNLGRFRAFLFIYAACYPVGRKMVAVIRSIYISAVRVRLERRKGEMSYFDRISRFVSPLSRVQGAKISVEHARFRDKLKDGERHGKWVVERKGGGRRKNSPTEPMKGTDAYV